MDGDGLDLKGTLDLLGRRFWLILVVTAIVLGAAGVALLVLRPIYTATALVLVDPSKKNLLDPDMEAGGSSFDSLRVDSEVELVKSETTLRAVVEHLDLAADAEFGVPPGLFGGCCRRLATPLQLRKPDTRDLLRRSAICATTSSCSAAGSPS